MIKFLEYLVKYSRTIAFAYLRSCDVVLFILYCFTGCVCWVCAMSQVGPIWLWIFKLINCYTKILNFSKSKSSLPQLQDKKLLVSYTSEWLVLKHHALNIIL